MMCMLVTRVLRSGRWNSIWCTVLITLKSNLLRVIKKPNNNIKADGGTNVPLKFLVSQCVL